MSILSVNNPNFYVGSDSDTIQCAINHAKENGLSAVVIPEKNERRNASFWEIDKAILLPSHMTVILENAHLRLKDGVISHVFVNELAWTEEGNQKENEQEEIHLYGIGNAVIDGGKPNGTSEQKHREDPQHFPNMYANLAVYFHNVRNFSVRGITFRDTRYWATCFMYCRNGYIGDLRFRNFGTVENQDGIDLRIGCEHITIENITGITGDDTIAMTALPEEEAESTQQVKGKPFDIHDITIKNVTGATHGCGLIRFLCECTAKEYNITVENVHDTGKAISGAAILFGTSDKFFLYKGARKMGDLKNIFIRNVFAKGQRGINFTEPCENIWIENFVVEGKNEVAFRFSENFAAKNVQLKHVSVSPDPAYAKAAFAFRNTPEENLKGLFLSDIHVENEPYIFSGREVPVNDFTFTAPTEGYFTEEPIPLLSAYMRYFETAYGCASVRPKDNRIDGTLKIEDEI